VGAWNKTFDEFALMVYYLVASIIIDGLNSIHATTTREGRDGAMRSGNFFAEKRKAAT
jgi:hypothetical protein